MKYLLFCAPLILVMWFPESLYGKENYGLERIVNRALEANWGMIDARDDIQRARLNLVLAESEFELKIFPVAGIGFSGGDDVSAGTDFSLGVSLEKKMEFGTEVALTPSIQKTDDQYQNIANLRITQPLLRGFGKEYTMSGVYSARFGERTSERSQYLREVDTVLGAVRQGYEVVRQRELLRLRQESFQRLKDQKEATVIKEQMGLVTAMDLYRIRIQLNQAEEELIRSRETYSDAVDTLKIFLALPLEKEMDVILPLDFDRIYPDVEEMIELAMANRLELEQVRDTLSETRRISRNVRKDILPDLDIRLSFSQQSDSSASFPGSLPDSTTWGISLGSTTDFRRTAQKAAYEDSLISVRQAARRQKILKDDISAQVKREIRNLDRLDKGIINQEDQIHQARGQLELAKVKFEHGMAGNFDLIEAEISLRRSQTQLVSAVIEYIVGQYRLRAVIGTLVQRS
jgi:outer membrane protein TolC